MCLSTFQTHIGIHLQDTNPERKYERSNNKHQTRKGKIKRKPKMPDLRRKKRKN
jgi:hypothetical protein